MSASFAFRAPGEGFNAAKVPGAYLDALVEMTADNSYPLTATNGYPFTAAQLPGGAYSLIESVDVVNPVMVNSTGVPQAFLAAWDKVHSTVRIFSLATDAELANANAGANGFVATLRVRFH
jgi:hypothetical protein